MAGTVRVVLCAVAIVIIIYGEADGKPLFGPVWCDLFCIEYEDGIDPNTVTTTTIDDYIYDMMDPCGGCPTRPSRTTTTTANPMMQSQPFNIQLPPSPNGMNLTMLNQGGQWLFNYSPSMMSSMMPATPLPASAASSASTVAPASTT